MIRRGAQLVIALCVLSNQLPAQDGIGVVLPTNLDRIGASSEYSPCCMPSNLAVFIEPWADEWKSYSWSDVGYIANVNDSTSMVSLKIDTVHVVPTVPALVYYDSKDGFLKIGDDSWIQIQQLVRFGYQYPLWEVFQNMVITD